ncbi:MAG: L-lactate dehydrogenase [Endomicrobiales bacterium]|nr:L-lactate dehydrogenase [Endomicrobiales bacterium]
MNRLKPKVSIIGCGNVGMRSAYALIISGIARQIVLVDRNMQRAEGEAMDLSHGAPYVSPVEVHAGTYSDIKDSDLVIITAGLKQKPGQTRFDLSKDNIELYRTIIPEIAKNAPGAIYLVVSNPVDVLSYAAQKISGKPHKEVIGSGTVLDSARLRFNLARHCRVDPRNIHAYILGEHGDTEFPVWSKAMIGGVFFSEYCVVCPRKDTCDHDAVLENIFSEVRDSAYKIIEKKGETSYGIGLAVARIAQAVLNDENAILPVSTLVEGYSGLGGVYLSLPVVLNRAGVRETMRINLNKDENEALLRSAEAIKKIIDHAGLR